MNKTFYAKITYTIDEEHPDMPYIKDWNKDKLFEFSDKYTFRESLFENDDELINYIKNDLRLVAGGGYNSQHIHNVFFDIKRSV